jgi:hypothetical protein
MSLMIAGGLCACSTVYVYQYGRNAFLIRTTSAAGRPGNALGMAASPDDLAKKASELCPAGYDRLTESNETFAGGMIEWQIRCRLKGAPRSEVP